MLQGCVTIQSHLHFGEIPITSTANAHTIDIENSRNGFNLADNLTSHASGSRIQQSVDGLPRQPRTYIHNHTRDSQSREWIGNSQPRNLEPRANPYQRKTDHDDATRPNVCREMERVSLKRLTVISKRRLAQRTRAPVVDRHR